jgi:hypothetical protein
LSRAFFGIGFGHPPGTTRAVFAASIVLLISETVLVLVLDAAEFESSTSTSTATAEYEYENRHERPSRTGQMVPSCGYFVFVRVIKSLKNATDSSTESA